MITEAHILRLLNGTDRRGPLRACSDGSASSHTLLSLPVRLWNLKPSAQKWKVFCRHAPHAMPYQKLINRQTRSRSRDRDRGVLQVQYVIVIGRSCTAGVLPNFWPACIRRFHDTVQRRISRAIYIPIGVLLRLRSSNVPINLKRLFMSAMLRRLCARSCSISSFRSHTEETEVQFS